MTNLSPPEGEPRPDNDPPTPPLSARVSDTLRTLFSLNELADHTLIIDDGMDRFWLIEIEDTHEIPFLWQGFTDNIDLSGGATVTVIACIGPEAVPLLMPLAADPRIGDVVRVHAGAWWPLSHPQECPPSGHPLAALEPADTPGVDVEDPQVMRDLLRPDPPDVLATIGRHLGTVIAAVDKPGQPGLLTQGTLLEHAESEREARADTRLPLRPRCVMGLLAAMDEPELWVILRTWQDAGALRLWLDLITRTPPGHRAPVAALIAGIAYEQQHPRWAQVAATYGLADNPRPDVLTVLNDLRDLTLTTKDLDTGLEEIVRPHQP